MKAEQGFLLTNHPRTAIWIASGHTDEGGSTMKAFSMNNVDVQSFMKALDSCKGEVNLITDEGDRFNLKSKLSQIAGLVNLIEGGKLVNARIYCSNPEDESLLFRLNLFGNGVEIAEK